MATEVIDFPFAGGIDEKTQSQLVEPGAVLTATNLRQVKNGSFQKRAGNAGISETLMTGGQLPQTAGRLMSYKDELCFTDGVKLYSRSSTANVWKTVAGRMPPAAITVQPTLALQVGVSGYDCVYSGGYHVVAYTIPLAALTWGVYGAVVDAANGAIVLPPVSLAGAIATACSPTVVLLTVGTKVVLLYSFDGTAGGNVWFTWIDTAGASTLNTGWSAAAIFVNNANAVPGVSVVFDACSLGASNFAIAYVNNLATGAGGANAITVARLNASFATLQTNTTIASGVAFGTGSRSISIDGDGSDVCWVAWHYNDTAAIWVCGLNPATLALTVGTGGAALMTGGPFLTLSVTRTGTQTGMLMASGDGSSNTMMATNFTVSGGNVAKVSWPLTNYRMNIESRAYQINSRWYCLMRPRMSGLNPNELFLVDMTSSFADAVSDGIANSFGYLRVCGHISPRLAYHPVLVNGGVVGRTGPPTRGSAVSSTKYVLPSPSLKNFVSSSLDLVTVDHLGTNRWEPAVLGEGMALAGAPPSYYDGNRVAEIGFFERPQIGSITAGGGAGLTGTFKYICTYEQIDARGQWHQSNPSDPYEIVATNDDLVVVCTSLQFTNRTDMPATVAAYATSPSNVRIALWRTVDGGNVYFRVPNAEAINYGGGSAVTFPINDIIADTALGAPCYAQPGLTNTAQVNVTPPPFSTLIVHGDRLVGACGRTWWFSKALVFGEGYAFCDAFQQTVETGGDITALASMDGALVIFKRDKIAFVDGQGPPDNGAGGDYSSPQFIAADVGCIEPRSVVLTPAGVMFQSLRGIEMLSRGRSLATYFGAHVEDTLAANPVITSAVLDEAKSLVIFTCTPTETSSTGVEIVWDYVHNTWFKDTLHDGAAIDSSVMRGQLATTTPVRTCHNRAAFTIFQDTSDYRDNTVYVAGDLKAPWIKMAGVQGYGRTCGVAILLESKTPCDILVTIRLDYRSTVVQTRLFTAAEIATLGTPTELYVNFKTQKCESFQVELTDATPTGGPAVGTGQGPAYVGMRIDYQKKQGPNRTSRVAGA